MKTFFWVFLLVGLAGCGAGTMPQTPDETKSVLDNSGFGKVIQNTVSVPYTTVIANLRSRIEIDKCMNGEASGIMSSHGMVAPPRSWHTSLLVLGPNKAQIVTQVEQMSTFQKLPPGGMYTLIIDVTAGSKSTTHFTAHYATMSDLLGDVSKMLDNIKSWSQGDKDCHKGAF